MKSLDVVTLDKQTAFRPGDVLKGIVAWSFADAAPEALELRLFWFTRGKGTQDVHVHKNLRLESPPLQGKRRFRFHLPDAPYSFSGKLVSLTWALEFVAEPAGKAERLEIVLSPSGAEIELLAPPG